MLQHFNQFSKENDFDILISVLTIKIPNKSQSHQKLQGKKVIKINFVF